MYVYSIWGVVSIVKYETSCQFKRPSMRTCTVLMWIAEYVGHNKGQDKFYL